MHKSLPLVSIVFGITFTFSLRIYAFSPNDSDPVVAQINLETSELKLEFKKTSLGHRFIYKFSNEPPSQAVDCKDLIKTGFKIEINSLSKKTLPPPKEWFQSPYTHDHSSLSKVSAPGIEELTRGSVPVLAFCFIDSGKPYLAQKIDLSETPEYQAISTFHTVLFLQPPQREGEPSYSPNYFKDPKTKSAFQALAKNPSPNKLADYVAECSEKLGPIPDIDCDQGVEIPVMQTTEQGTKKLGFEDFVDNPRQKCDTPAWLGYSDRGFPCSPYSRIGRIQNTSGSEFVFFCRKYFPRPADSDLFDDVNMIGHNPQNGETCFFNSKLNYSGAPYGVSGKNIPSLSSPESLNFWLGIGPLASNKCAESCHSNDPFLHTPIVDQLDRQGNYVGNCIVNGDASNCFVPSFPIGAYKLTHNHVLGWNQSVFLDSEFPSCTSCHRIGQGNNIKFSLMAVDHLRTRSFHPYLPTFQLNPKNWMPPESSDSDSEALEMTKQKLEKCISSPGECKRQ